MAAFIVVVAFTFAGIAYLKLYTNENGFVLIDSDW